MKSETSKLADSFRETELGTFPVSWDLVTLGAAFDVQQGKALSPSARSGISPRPFLRTANVLWGRLDLTWVDQMDFTKEEAERLSLQPSDLLVCEGGEIGRTAIWNGEMDSCLYQNHVHRLRKKREDILPAFVMYWMQAAFLHLRLYGGVGNKTTIPNLSGARLKQLPIPLPPFPEQQAIATVLSKIQTTVEVQDKLVTTLKELKAATMAKLFREGLRGERLKQTEIGKIPESWKVVSVGDLFKVELGKMLSPKSKKGINPRPYLRNKNVQWGRFDLTEVFEMDFTDDEFERFRLEPGDILVCEGGEPGRTAVWGGEIPDCCYQKALHRLRPRDRNRILQRYYLYWATAAFTIFRSYKPSGTKTTIAHLPKEKLEVLEMALPDLSEQKQIVQILDDLDRQLLTAEQKAATLKSLFSSMLHLLMTGQVRVTPKMIALQAMADREEKQRKKPRIPLDERVLQDIVQRIVEAVAPEKIILFGSAARGEMTRDSDLDFLVVKSCENRRETAWAIRRQLIGVAKGIAKDIIVVTPQDVEQHKDTIGFIIRPAMKEGRTLYAA